jgi:hypothetical protein
MAGGACRVGYGGPGNSLAEYSLAIAGDPYSSGAPLPPSGTAGAHTQILGVNHGNCAAAGAKTHIHGGYGTKYTINLAGANYVDFACFDITDFSPCGKANQTRHCITSYPLDDYADNGMRLSNTTQNTTITDVNIHGMAVNGISGPTGDGVVMDHVDILGNAASGWDADNGDGTTGKGSLLVRNYNISWNGCAEEYPVVHPLPYGDCTDQDHGGYGDGFGTTTKDSDPPGWQVHFDQGIVSYNTQDGLDALHIGGNGSSMSVTHALAFSNMGQQIKVGGATATITDSYIVGNCGAMSQAIPGTPSGYNAHLDLFCRAGNTAVSIEVPTAQPAIFQRNTIYSNNKVALEIEYPGNQSSSSAAIKYDDNIFIGFSGSDGQYPSPIYSNTNLKMFTNPGASFNHNVTYHARSNWRCPATSLHETAGNCSDPHLKDESWHPYGHGDTTHTAPIDQNTSQIEPRGSDTVSYGAVALKSFGAVALVTGLWRGLRYLKDRTTKT